MIFGNLIQTKNKQVQTIRILLIPFIFFACVCCISCEQRKVESPDDKLPLQLTAIQTNNGWGYEVYVDNKLYIKQENIPGVSGFQYFKTKEDALKIGNLVIEKMKHGKKFPAISLEELESAGITVK